MKEKALITSASGQSSGLSLKVCGMQQPGNMLQVAELQPDYLGLIFYEKSPRYFDGELPAIAPEIKKVGVFVNSSLKEIKDKVSKRSLNITMSSGIIMLAWSIYNMVFQFFVMINKDEENKPYYILFLTAMLLYPIMRSSINTYLKCYTNYKNLFSKLIN